MVNGNVAQPGMSIDPARDIVFLNGKIMDFGQLSAGKDAAHSYILLHKPVEVVSTARDPEGRRTVLDILPEKFKRGKEGKKKRLYPVGRLDYFSEGLIILTDDGELTHRLTHPGFNLPRVYLVTVRGLVSEAKLEIMRRGMTLSEGDELAPMQVELLSSSLAARNDIAAGHDDYWRLSQGIAPDNEGSKGNSENGENSDNRTESGMRSTRGNSIVTVRENVPTGHKAGSLVLKMTLTQGLNRQIRRVCRDLQLTILRLCRISHGPLQLGNLKPRDSRFLSENEVNALRRAVSLPEKHHSTGASCK